MTLAIGLPLLIVACCFLVWLLGWWLEHDAERIRKEQHEAYARDLAEPPRQRKETP